MEYINLKNSSLSVSRICMGGCPLGGYGWGDVQKKDLISAVEQAVECGINFFDTADTYGLGESERLLGNALKGKRHNVVIQDKFGVRAQPGKPTLYDNSKSYIISACEASLKRLCTDYIDIYTVHYRDGKTPLGDVVNTLEQLRREGKIRYFALSNINEKDELELAECKGRFVTFQNEYSLACRKNEKDMFRFRDEFDLTPLTWGSLGQGILTGKYDESNVYFEANDRRSRDIYVNFHGDKLRQNLRIVARLREIAASHGKPVAAAAMRFILDYISGSAVLAGAKNPNQVLQNAEAADWRLDKSEIDSLLEISG